MATDEEDGRCSPVNFVHSLLSEVGLVGWLVFMETWFLCVALTVLELTLNETGLQPRSTCLFLLSAGIQGLVPPPLCC